MFLYRVYDSEFIDTLKHFLRPLNSFSSDLHKLFAYLQHEYGAFIENYPITVFDKIRSDQAIIGLFCQILKKRMFIIDDMEF